MEKLRVLELFAGIGACSKALERLNIPHEIVDAVEIDKYAIKSFNAIHNTNFEPQDITKWDKDIDVDLIMHGSPCQDFSSAGKQAGGDVGSGTRSSLMYETIRIVEKLRPKYVVWENVKNLLSKKHKHNFDAYLEIMEKLGYKNYYQVLNAKDYNVPQNRERVFTISILGKDEYNFPKGNIQDCEVINPLKDISGKSWQFEQNIYSENSVLRSLKAGGGSGNIPKVIEHFQFPSKQPLKLKLKGILEDEVDEKYYLSDEQVNKIKNSSFNQEKEYCDTLCARDWKDPKYMEVNRKYGIFDTKKSTHQAGSVYDTNGLSPTLDTMQGGYRQPCVEVRDDIYSDESVKRIRSNIIKSDVAKTLMANAMQSFNHNNCALIEETYVSKKYNEFIDKNGYIPEMYNPYNNSELTRCDCLGVTVKTIGNYSPSGHNASRIVDNNGIAPTVMENHGTVTATQDKCLRIRKLTPKECYRLMGFNDEDFEKAQNVPTSNAQLYKQAGNSIVVNVLEAIFKELFKDYIPSENKWRDLD